MKDSRDGNSPKMFLENGQPVRKPLDMANIQMNFYEKKVKDILNMIPKSTRNPHRVLDLALSKWDDRNNVQPFNFRDVTLVEMHNLISSLSESTAYGNDTIDSIGIKIAITQLTRPIQHLINTSLRKSKFAQKWKFARLIPRYKGKGEKILPSSYQPVAQLSTVSKLVERAAQQQLLNFVENTNQLNYSNHAYRKNLSTTTTLLEIADEINQGIEINKITSVMALDQTAAFNCISFNLLLEKLERYQVGPDAHRWIRDYLNERTQYVVIGTSTSYMSTVTAGVPQGSVIGPLLYAIYTNELSNAVKSPNCTDDSHLDTSTLFGRQCTKCGTLTVYADDSTYTVTDKTRHSNQNNLRRSLNEITLLLQDNQLKINQPKTTLIEIMIKQKKGRNRGTPPSLVVEKVPGTNVIVEDSKHMRILGANLQSNMGWAAHMEIGEKALLPGVRKQVGQLKYLGRLVPLSSRMNLANGLILSRMTYLMPLWGGGGPRKFSHKSSKSNESDSQMGNWPP